MIAIETAPAPAPAITAACAYRNEHRLHPVVHRVLRGPDGATLHAAAAALHHQAVLNKLDVLDLFVVEVDARLQVDRQLDIVKLFDLPDVDVRQEFLQLLIVLLACGIGCVGDLEGRIAYRCSKRTRRLSPAARRQAHALCAQPGNTLGGMRRRSSGGARLPIEN